MMNHPGDLIGIVIKATKNLYGDLDCRIKYVEKLDEGHGAAFFPDDGSQAQVYISAQLPLIGAVEVMAHELAHVVAGKDEDHGPKWQEAFNQINGEYHNILAG